MAKKINIDEEKMLELYRSGISNSAIGRHFGIGHNGISRRLEKYGLTSNKRSILEFSGDDIKCVECGNFMPIQSFETSTDGRLLRRKCKNCHNTATVIRRFSNEERRIKNKLARLKKSAAEDGLPFNLDYKYMKDLLVRQQNKCFYTDQDIIFWKHAETPRRGLAPSVDKIVPSDGYIKGNVVWCLDRINRMKSDVTLYEMSVWMPDWYKRVQTRSDIYKF